VQGAVLALGVRQSNTNLSDTSGGHDWPSTVSNKSQLCPAHLNCIQHISSTVTSTSHEPCPTHLLNCIQHISTVSTKFPQLCPTHLLNCVQHISSTVSNTSQLCPTHLVAMERIKRPLKRLGSTLSRVILQGPAPQVLPNHTVEYAPFIKKSIRNQL